MEEQSSKWGKAKANKRHATVYIRNLSVIVIYAIIDKQYNSIHDIKLPKVDHIPVYSTRHRHFNHSQRYLEDFMRPCLLLEA